MTAGMERENGISMDELFVQVRALMGTSAFGGCTPQSHALKALHEAKEFAADPGAPEAADILICLLAWVNSVGIEPDDLIVEALEKMDINRARTWTVLADGTVQHVDPGGNA